MPISIFKPQDEQKTKVVKVALADADTAGGVVAIPNPFGADVLIHSGFLRVTTVATGAATVDVGIAADAETSDDALLDGGDVNGATGLKPFSGPAIWGASQFVTASEASGDVTGLEGFFYAVVSRA